MKRRWFIAMLASIAGTGPRAVIGQQGIKRVGFLSPQSASLAASMLRALREGMRDLGWVEGQNIALELRYADGAIDRLPQIAAELVQKNLDVMVAGSNPGVLAAKRAIGTLPIVMVTTGDPIAGGIIDSFARPGANVTGVTAIAQDLIGKNLNF